MLDGSGSSHDDLEWGNDHLTDKKAKDSVQSRGCLTWFFLTVKNNCVALPSVQFLRRPA